MIIVVDTNVLISAIRWGGVPREVVNWILSDPTRDWVVSPEILEEHLAVASRPAIRLSPQETASLRQTLFTLRVMFPQPVSFTPDPGDAKFIALAMASHADVLVTGDSRLLRAQLLPPTRAMTARQFHNEFCCNP